MESHASTAHGPSFSRMWSEPVPKLSSPQMLRRPASIRLPKNFHPVGVSKHSTPAFAATRSSAAAVGIDLASPLSPLLKYGMHWAFAAMMATESEGVTKKLLPKIMLRSPSPSDAAPKSGASGANIVFTSSSAYVRLGSGWPPAKSSLGTSLTQDSGSAPRTSTKMGLAYAPVMACMASNFIAKSARVTSDLIKSKSKTVFASVR
mmetsp:Transcript_4179/g.15319  ORF Transcript_4179/g.15319 Transcript_4179/m.15319 type:complete len:205 (-) Transcript_4179:767-1381(-)